MFGTFMIASCGATGKTKQGYFLSRGKVVTAHSGTLRVVPSPKECASCSKTPYQAVRQHARNRNVMKPTGTGSSRGPHLRWGMGAQMFNSNALVRVEHFYPVPVCFGVIRALMQRPLGGGGGLKHENRVYVSRGILFPLLPFGLSSPAREKFTPPKMRDILFVLLIKFESRIEIIKRRTVLTERRSRGEEGDSTRTAPVST